MSATVIHRHITQSPLLARLAACRSDEQAGNHVIKPEATVKPIHSLAPIAFGVLEEAEGVILANLRLLSARTEHRNIA